MTLIYTIGKGGVYEHFVPGVWSTLERALAEATRLAEADGFRSGESGESDGYHEWNIYAYSLDQGPEGGGLVGTLAYEQKGRWVDGLFCPASGLRFAPKVTVGE
jgi:hypothetical protein